MSVKTLLFPTLIHCMSTLSSDSSSQTRMSTHDPTLPRIPVTEREQKGSAVVEMSTTSIAAERSHRFDDRCWTAAGGTEWFVNCGDSGASTIVVVVTAAVIVVVVVEG